MKIHNVSNDWRSLTQSDSDKPDAAHARNENDPAYSIHGDHIDLTATAKETLASLENTSGLGIAAEEVSEVRVAEIRERLKTGFYESSAVLAATARRIMDFYS